MQSAELSCAEVTEAHQELGLEWFDRELNGGVSRQAAFLQCCTPMLQPFSFGLVVRDICK